MSGKKKVLYPEYFEKFQCIGGDCEDSCCAGFRVDIDRKTYRLYKKIGDPELQPILDSVIKTYEKPISDTFYGYIDFEDREQCPLLSSDGWCTVHRNHGESALGLVCHSYPRFTNLVDDVREKSGTMACPEMARLALLNKQGIQFIEAEESGDERNNIGFTFHADNVPAHFWEMRLLTLHTLQNRSYTMNKRMLILAMFFQKAHDAQQTRDDAGISSWIEKFRAWSESGQIASALGKLPTSEAFQFNVLRKLLNERSKMEIKSKRYRKLHETVMRSYGLTERDEPLSTEQIADYKQKIDQFGSLLEQRFSYVLENYMVNMTFKYVFPANGRRKLFDEFMMLAIHFVIVRFMLVGVYAAQPETFDEAAIIECIQSFSKEVEHNAFFMKYMYEQLLANECNTLAKMTLILHQA